MTTWNDKTTLITSSSNRTYPSTDDSLPNLRVTEDTRGFVWLFSPAMWDGRHVWVGKCTLQLDDPMFLATTFDSPIPICGPFQHDLSPMTHHNPDGEDWGTGFLTCNKCLGSAHDPEAWWRVSVR